LDKNRIYIIGIGPGKEEMMTVEALKALDKSDVIIGYTVYIDLLGERFFAKEKIATPMRQESKRCRICFEEAEKGKQVALICSGDAGIYGLASLMYEMGKEYPETELVVIPGITAASSGAALLGAPLNHDFCVISLSDLLTPWEKIERRLIAAAEGDFAIVIYNPSSHKRKDYLMKACDILLGFIEEERPCGYVENIGRDCTKVVTCTLKELRETQVNMFTTVFIGNSGSEIINGKLVTKRGYQIEKNTDICRNNRR
jgi:precorrin-3B C17-methyltransferase